MAASFGIKEEKRYMEKYVAVGIPVGPLTADKNYYVMANGLLFGIDLI